MGFETHRYVEPLLCQVKFLPKIFGGVQCAAAVVGIVAAMAAASAMSAMPASATHASATAAAAPSAVALAIFIAGCLRWCFALNAIYPEVEGPFVFVEVVRMEKTDGDGRFTH